METDPKETRRRALVVLHDALIRCQGNSALLDYGIDVSEIRGRLEREGLIPADEVEYLRLLSPALQQAFVDAEAAFKAAVQPPPLPACLQRRARKTPDPS